MADAYPWCFNKDTSKLGDLETGRDAYLAEIEKIHSKVDDAEWANITAPMKLDTHPKVSQFVDLPASATSGPWWELTDPDCWGPVRDNIISNYDITAEIQELRDLPLGLGTSSPEVYAALQSLFSDDWKSDTFSEFSDTIRIIESEIVSYSRPGPAADIIVGAPPQSYADFVLLKIQRKLENIKCYSILEIEQQWKNAVLALAEPQIDKEASIAVAEAAKKRTTLRKGGGRDLGFYDAKERERFKEQARKKIEKKIEDAIREEIEEAFADDIAFGQQCVLLSYMSEIIESKEQRDASINFREQLPYVNDSYNKPIKLTGEPFGFMNRLVIDPSQRQFFNIDNATLSSLIPHMRFYKVSTDDKGVDFETEIEFDSNGKDSIFKGNVFRKQRGHGVGLRSFNFSYDGTDPFSAKKMIAAKLSIYASTFDELLRERLDPNNRRYQYAELALKTGGVTGEKKDKLSLSEIEKENLDKLNFRLKATLGWSIADNSVFKKLEKNNLALYNAIYNSFITIYLTPTIHNFSFDETGAVTFDIEYLAYIEDVFSQKTYNIFSSLTKEILAREAVFEYFESIGCTNLDPESEDETNSSQQFKEFLREDEKSVANINAEAFSLLMSELQKNDKIYYLNFNKENMRKLAENPAADVPYPVPTTAPNDGSLAATIASSVSDAAGDLGIDADEALLSVVAVSQENNNIPFFYFGDLVEVVMRKIEDDLQSSSDDDLFNAEYIGQILARINNFDAAQISKKIDRKKVKAASGLRQFRKLRVLLGPIEVFNPLKTDKTIITSLADIPVSTNYFFEFMSDRVLSKEILSYPFSKFMKDFINDLIENFLNSGGCMRVDKSQKIKLNTTTINAFNRMSNSNGQTKQNGQYIDDITNSLLNGNIHKQKGQPVLLLGGTRNTPKEALSLDRMVSYSVYTVGRKSPITNYVGNKSADENNGIFHYIIGKDKGFVKNITLEKTTATGLKEVRFEQEGYNGLEQLREVYNAKIETFLNVQTFPGTYVYVEPHGFAPNTTTDLTRYGIGGYCMVVKTEHTISPGTADTTLHTVWVASKEGDSPKNKKKKSSNSAAVTTREPEGPEAIKKCLVGPHNIGLLVTRRGRYKGLTDEQAGELGSASVKSGIYEV